MLGIHVMAELTNLEGMILVLILVLGMVLVSAWRIKLPEWIRHRPVRGVRHGGLPRSNAPGA